METDELNLKKITYFITGRKPARTAGMAIGPDVGHPRRDDSIGHSQVAARHLLGVPRTSAAQRESPGRSHSRGLRTRCQYAQGGSAGAILGHDGHQQIAGVAAVATVPGPRRSGYPVQATDVGGPGLDPYVWLDAQYLKVRDGDRVISLAFVVATDVTQAGDSEILGFDRGLSEEAPFWAAFLRDLAARGLRGVQWVISERIPGSTLRFAKSSKERVGSGAACTLCAVS